jgi:hypothetical protein
LQEPLPFDATDVTTGLLPRESGFDFTGGSDMIASGICSGEANDNFTSVMRRLIDAETNEPGSL